MITLAIIGIVAAITVPNLNSKTNNQVLHSQFLKAYSDLNQAAKLFYIYNGISVRDEMDSTPQYTDGDEVTDVLITFMQSTFKGIRNTKIHINYPPDATYDILYGKGNATNIKKEETQNSPCDKSTIILDSQGRMFWMDDSTLESHTQNYYYGPKICVDINGAKAPNRYGVDRFTFVFTRNNTVVPYTGQSTFGLGQQQTDENEIKKSCLNDITSHTCAHFALKNINPEGAGDYWNDFLKGKL